MGGGSGGDDWMDDAAAWVAEGSASDIIGTCYRPGQLSGGWAHYIPYRCIMHLAVTGEGAGHSLPPGRPGDRLESVCTGVGPARPLVANWMGSRHPAWHTGCSQWHG